MAPDRDAPEFDWIETSKMQAREALERDEVRPAIELLEPVVRALKAAGEVASEPSGLRLYTVILDLLGAYGSVEGPFDWYHAGEEAWVGDACVRVWDLASEAANAACAELLRLEPLSVRAGTPCIVPDETLAVWDRAHAAMSFYCWKADSDGGINFGFFEDDFAILEACELHLAAFADPAVLETYVSAWKDRQSRAARTADPQLISMLSPTGLIPNASLQAILDGGAIPVKK